MEYKCKNCGKKFPYEPVFCNNCNIEFSVDNFDKTDKESDGSNKRSSDALDGYSTIKSWEDANGRGFLGK